MLIVKKSDSYRLFSETKTNDDERWRHFRKAAFSFSGWIGLPVLKTWEGKNDG